MKQLLAVLHLIFLEFELSGVSAIESSRIINCWKESANWAIIWKKKKKKKKV